MSTLVEKDEKGVDAMRKPIEYYVDLNTGCFICTSHYRNEAGYPKISVDGKKLNMSRYIYELNYDKIPPDMLVMHICDNPSCINPLHLKLGSHQENMVDRNNKQRQARGENNGRSKLTEGQVKEILRSNLPKRRLAKMYGVVPAVIRKIKNGVLWRHVYDRVFGNDNVTMLSEYKKVNTHHTDNIPHRDEVV